MRVILYKRHKQNCSHKGNKSYRRCDCSIWLEINHKANQHRESSKTSNWELAEDKARELKDRFRDKRQTATPELGEKGLTVEEVVLSCATDTTASEYAIRMTRQVMAEDCSARKRVGFSSVGKQYWVNIAHHCPDDEHCEPKPDNVKHLPAEVPLRCPNYAPDDDSERNREKCDKRQTRDSPKVRGIGLVIQKSQSRTRNNCGSGHKC